MKKQLMILGSAIALLVGITACHTEKKDEVTDVPFSVPEGIDTTIAGIDVVYVEAGISYTMGADTSDKDADKSEKVKREVSLSDFYISKYPVTQKQWEEIMGNNPSSFTGDENRPVENVSYEDVQEFIAKLNEKTGKKFRLPSEAEWEYAARGGKYSKNFKYSGSNFVDKVAWRDSTAEATTHPVGQKQSNELGIYDMSGNVYEWCADTNTWKDSVYVTTDSLIRAKNKIAYVLRGGSWVSSAKYCRVSSRNYFFPEGKFNHNGFRLAIDVE